MKSVRALVALFLLAVFLAGPAHANTSSVNPNVPAQNSPLSSSVLRGNFANAQSDINTIFAIIGLSSNQLLGTVNAGNAGPLNLPTCSTGALSWTPGTGFGCNSISGLTSPVTQNLVFTGQHAINLNAASLPNKQTGTVLQIGNADTIPSRIENDAFGSTAYFSGVRFDGTNASPTTLQSSDEITGVNAWGFNGSSVVGPRASVRAYASQNWTGSAQGTRVDIATTLNNTTTMSPVCSFENDGGMMCPPTVTGGDKGAGTINASAIYVNGNAVTTGSSGSSALVAPRASYTSDTAGNLFPLLYTGAGGNAAASEWTQGVVASLGSDVTLQLRFPMPSVIPSGTFKLVSYCLANATSGAAKYTIQDADVGAANPSSASLSSETQTTVSFSAADTYVVTKTPLTSVPVADHTSVVAITFNHTSWTLTANLGCSFYELWE